MKAANASAEPTFIQADVSQLRNVDTVCATIAEREPRLNLLFMTIGAMTLSGRTETPEGLDRKFALHYYARMRFAQRLQPQLSAAGKAGQLSRVVSVFDPVVSVRNGGSGKLDYNDLSLKKSFSLSKCGAHASLMGNFFLEGRARAYPETSFIHAWPNGVATNLLRDLPAGRVLSAVLNPLLRPFLVPLDESGARHLFTATSPRFPPKDGGVDMQGDVAMGSEGTRGSGSYWVNWDAEVYPPNKKMDNTRHGGAVDKVTLHTHEVFTRVCAEGKTYP